MTDFEMPECVCPHCGKQINGASNVTGERKPDPNDVTLCIYCGKVAVFDANLHLREPTVDEIIEIARDGRVDKLRKLWLKWNKQHKGLDD